ncbi:MAG: Ig-like domain-containing protein, partial [Anaerovoracaceae bacterium]
SNADNKQVRWISSDNQVARVIDKVSGTNTGNALGVVTGLAPGKAVITAITLEGSYAATALVTVNRPVESLSLNKTNIDGLVVGNKEILRATIMPEDASDKTLIYASGNNNIATVSQMGEVEAKAPGTTSISVRSKDGAKIAIATITVVKSVTGVTLDKTNINLAVAESDKITAYIVPGDANNKNITWSSSDSLVASVDGRGKVTGHKAGITIISAMSEDGGKIASAIVTIVQKVESISINKNQIVLNIGETSLLLANILPANASNKAVTWTSSNTAIADVNQLGEVTGVGKGQAVITATSQDGNKTATVVAEITSLQLVTTLTINERETNLVIGDTKDLSAKVLPENADDKIIEWSSSNPAVASVNNNGKITAITKGNTIIKAINIASGLTDTVLVSVKENIRVSDISLNKTSANLNVGEEETFVPIITPANASNKAVSWNSSNPLVANVDENGKVRALAIGTASIIATTIDGSKIASLSLTIGQQILVTGVSLNKTDLTLNIGNGEVLAANILPANASIKNLLWTSMDPAIADVSPSGEVTGY